MEETERQRRQETQAHFASSTTSLTTTSEKKDIIQIPVETTVERRGGGGDSDNMGRHRTSSECSSVSGWVETGEQGSIKLVQSPTTPRQSSKRDSGYHTDCSPATFSALTPTTQFTFETPVETLTPPIDPVSNLLEPFSGFEESQATPPRSSDRDPNLEPLSSSQAVSPPIDSKQGSLAETSLPTLEAGSKRGSKSSQDDDEDDDIGSSHRQNPESTPSHSTHSYQARPWSISTGERFYYDDEDGGDDAFVSDDVDIPPHRSGSLRSTDFPLSPRHVQSALTSPTLHPEEVERPELSSLQENLERSEFLEDSNLQREIETGNDVQIDDSDDDDEDVRGCEMVARTDYHHGLLSVFRLPGGGRLRPLVARSTATQTPHLHCQLIRQILNSPLPLPVCARGSAVRRLRCYSEGAESITSLAQGPLPDLVPVSHSSRERSQSSPEIETLQNQCETARAVGRELRRLSDEFAESYEAMRRNQNGALVSRRFCRPK